LFLLQGVKLFRVDGRLFWRYFHGVYGPLVNIHAGFPGAPPATSARARAKAPPAATPRAPQRAGAAWSRGSQSADFQVSPSRSGAPPAPRRAAAVVERLDGWGLLQFMTLYSTSG
jgi:hypothetical protein